MVRKIRLNGRRFGSIGTTRGYRTQEGHEFFRRARRECIDRMRYDVGVSVALEMKPDRDAARARIRIVIGTVGIPAKSEKRTLTVVEARFRCGARVRFLAPARGVKVPDNMMPLACAGRNPACTPPLTASKASRTSRQTASS